MCVLKLSIYFEANRRIVAPIVLHIECSNIWAWHFIRKNAGLFVRHFFAPQVWEKVKLFTIRFFCVSMQSIDFLTLYLLEYPVVSSAASDNLRAKIRRTGTAQGTLWYIYFEFSIRHFKLEGKHGRRRIPFSSPRNLRHFPEEEKVGALVCPATLSWTNGRPSAKKKLKGGSLEKKTSTIFFR